jgi:AcrR family transcriptional regulator
MNDIKVADAGNPPLERLGRPRRFQDDDVFVAMGRILEASGYARLTIGAVGEQVGCTGAALISRFGSKQGLLRGYLDWAYTESAQRFRRVRETYCSPLEALHARFRAPAAPGEGEAGGSPWCLGLVVAYAVAWAEPSLREFETTWRAMFSAEIIALLDDAVTAGELIECDTARLGTTLIAALTGAALQAVATREFLHDPELQTLVETIIGPYRST